MIKTKSVWKHPQYNIGYCFNRNEMIYTRINNNVKTTGLRWLPQNKSLALEILRKRIVAHLERKNVMPKFGNTLTLQKLYTEFLDHKRKVISKNRYFIYERAISIFLDYDLVLIDDTVQVIRQRIMSITNELQSHLHINTIKAYLHAIQAIFNYAIEMDYISKNPVTLKFIPKAKTSVVVLPSLDDFFLQFLN